MTDPANRKGMSHCPVCGGAGEALLSLAAQPIYQHPVPRGVVVPEPHTVDLRWIVCSDCAHAWQPAFDEQLLERIYRSHYYTPAPDGIAVTFRKQFLDTLADFGLAHQRSAILEIGASGGDVLCDLQRLTETRRVYAFEPDEVNAQIAKQRGITVYRRFFGRDALPDDLELADLAYARHVIEHVFDFEDFFAGLNTVTAPAADVVLETPSLDYHGSRGSMAPFHVEHIHVFSLRSLTRLCLRHGWELRHSAVTEDGNLIAAFMRADLARRNCQDGLPAPPSLDDLQAAIDSQGEQLRRCLKDRRLVFWGAGSTGITLANLLGREPDFWTDGNPGKYGKVFVGRNIRIVSPEEAFAGITERSHAEAVLVIASSFVSEILPRVRALGWKGRVVDSSGTALSE